ncbi:Zinc finger FYVE domain-containing protein 9 [Fragariocoptes setiger]|uniref:Zinc finger FYVE domain-containing protein 9 n=1 Tax=Fragariocoptes setiger TaxID=1670756 RepID=A0ABQ7S903_9ACAR|nr:Zinc finger FYVE domain-containing protein 9 [Fragariocoptes setiger]
MSDSGEFSSESELRITHQASNQNNADTRETMTPTTQSDPNQHNPGNITSESSPIIRIPGTHPPEWIPDSQAPTCMSCGVEFNLIKRRHHCRACGLIFCSSCCDQKEKLPYMDNKEARVCHGCLLMLNLLLSSSTQSESVTSPNQTESNPTQYTGRSNNVASTPQRLGSAMRTSITRPSALARSHDGESTSASAGVSQDVPQNQSNSWQQSSSSSGQTNAVYPKQVIFSDGVRPGTDLTESSRTGYSNFDRNPTMFDRRHRAVVVCSKHKSKRHRSSNKQSRRSAVPESNLVSLSDNFGQLPPIVFTRAPVDATDLSNASTDESQQSQLPTKDFDSLVAIENNMSSSVNMKFLLLKNLFLNVQVLVKNCCVHKKDNPVVQSSHCDIVGHQGSNEKQLEPQFWSFVSEGLAPLGQSEVVILLDKPVNENHIPREIFKTYLTLHELAIRGRPIGHLGHLLFGEGIFHDKANAGFCFMRPMRGQCLKGISLPQPPFLVALLIQRWEVPWAKLFPLRLLLRLGYECSTYPTPVVSFRKRKPVFYEVGHTIISILADFRNYQYSITNVPDMSVVINKELNEVNVTFRQNQYHQVFKVLGNSNNEHVLAWCSSYTAFSDAHLVVTQNDDGQYENIEFPRVGNNCDNEIKIATVGASFVVFSGSLKTNQLGQTAKISVVEDGILVQVQSNTMTALRSAVRYMNPFDISTGTESRPGSLKSIKIAWENTTESVSLDPEFAVVSPIDGSILDDINFFQNIKIHSSPDFLSDSGYVIRWTDVYLHRESGLSNEMDPSRLAEEIAQSFCLSMASHLDKLIEEGYNILGLRIALNETNDEIGFEVGSKGKHLPLVYLNELDSTILPMISAIGGSMNLVVELIFHILSS